MADLLPVLLKRSKVAGLVARYTDKSKRLNSALVGYLDAVDAAKCHAVDIAFEQGFKAGVRLQTELKAWSEDE